ncbi:hypothetical protein COT78_03210 [Candidatus Berkelbacteria bacterium CG10_big_fil_rev_8_21_14_0_10_43_13]|uniref:Elp3/MiaA/NifB-like radical SAM core domain-containing protein n=1 Tax=Candidatus Berkelbacteria bacterium CG10_big_fil_rev_8_21_14_0_10_43_13 TaxID=1974514 RepID=A0A2H0W841_9BACT|nr:MAG: hypothetical protein COT78_03210 [Candidatus Berkelbacteria bacterium CG10_big_fil_rev_8_21_14_0_10_43_13]
MGSIAAYLRTKNFEADLCFLERESSGLHNPTAIIGEDKKFVVIAKPNFKDYHLMFPILRKLKKLGVARRVFFCGPFASINSRSMLEQNAWLDGVILGQPEETASELIAAVAQKGKWRDTRGGIWRLSSGGLCEIERKINISLSDLPFPARDVEIGERGKYINIEASRGCIYSCSFCHVGRYWKGNGNEIIFNFRDSKLVVDEMEQIHKKLGKTLFIFNDTIFWRNKHDNQRLIDFAREVIKRKLRIRFYVYLRCEPFIDENVLELLTRAGLVRIFLGLENASRNSQSTFNKLISIEQYKKITLTLDRLKVNAHIGYIVFEPHSTPQDIKLNIDLLYEICKLFRLGTILEPARIIRGTLLHKKLIDERLIEPALGYESITYGYKFKDPRTEKIFRTINTVFVQKLGDVTFNYEYYITTIGVLKTLLLRERPDIFKAVEEKFEDFDKIKLKSMKMLKVYFTSLIAAVVRGEKVAEIVGSDLSSEFIGSFSEVFQDIAVRYALILSQIKNLGGAETVDEIYRGIDRIA